MRRFLNLMATLLALVLFAAGCNSGTPSDAQTNDLTEKPTEITEVPTQDIDKETEKSTIECGSDDELKGTVLSADLGKYTVVVDGSADAEVISLAESLTKTFNDQFGLSVAFARDEDTAVGEYEILIGNTDRPETEEFKTFLPKGSCGYAAVGKKIVILGKADQYTETAIILFSNLMVIEKDISGENYMTEKDTHIVDATNMISVMSYNVWYGGAITNGDSVVEMIRNYMPDFLGVQEAQEDWMSAIGNGLSESGYESFGLARDANGRGERSAIFYRADKFELLESETFWLSDTPTEVSKVSGSNCNRVVTVGVFLRISDGLIFTYANTHLDHSNSDVRTEQITFLDRYVRDFAEGEFIVTGDFNLTPASSEYSLLMDMGYQSCGTVAEYARGRNDNTYTGGSLIDFCFRACIDNFDPYFYAVCDELVNGELPSDHHPVYVMLEFK